MRDDTLFIDLRSDTVTRPTDAMRKAMSEAVVGDDRYGEDPTVRRLEEIYADLVGKEAALYVPSGTMANQVALRSWTSPGDIVLAGKNQHVLQYERNGSARNSSVQINPLDDTTGTLNPDEVASELSLLRFLGHTVALVCVENTHMPTGGQPWSLRALDAVREASAGVPIHMDGARLFNACAATGVSAREYGARVDSVMSCVSKGLGAPVGSLLAGSREFIERARIHRQILGGQMRQAGVIAAAGIVALEQMRERLTVDHDRAQRLGAAVYERFGDKALSPEDVRTNIVVFAHQEPSTFLGYLEANGILAGAIAPGKVRLVTHNDVDDAAIDRAVSVIASAP
jgi:threonine aldolase